MATRHQETTIHIDDTIKTGNLYLKRGKNGQIMPYYYIDCSLPNLPPRLTRFDRSTGMTDINLATKKAITMCQEEYKHRLSYGDRSKNISNVKLYENFINFMKKNVAGSVPKLKGGAWTYDDLKKNRGFVENYIAPSIGRKELKNIKNLELLELYEVRLERLPRLLAMEYILLRQVSILAGSFDQNAKMLLCHLKM